MLALRPLFSALPSQQHPPLKHTGCTSVAVAYSLPWDGQAVGSTCSQLEDAGWAQSTWQHPPVQARRNAGTVRQPGKGRLLASQNGNQPTPDRAVLVEVEG